MTVQSEILKIKRELLPNVKLVAVSKFKPIEAIEEAYSCGQRLFGENRPQELMQKAMALPKDIEWHFIGHLQSNKLKMVLPYAHLIHSVDSEKLLFEIDKYAERLGIEKVNCLLQVHVAEEESKQGFSVDELLSFAEELSRLKPAHISIRGIMGMASFTDDRTQIESEFRLIKDCFNKIESCNYSYFSDFKEISMGMSGDYKIAELAGSTLVRIGSQIFGSR